MIGKTGQEIKKVLIPVTHKSHLENPKMLQLFQAGHSDILYRPMLILKRI